MAKDQATSLPLKPETTYKRLPSFKSPRDLNLSQLISKSDNRTKKIFVPNLNVQRRKPHESENSCGSSEERRDKTRRDKSNEDKGRTRQDRKDKKQFVQTSGVFSDGLAPQLKQRSSAVSAYSSNRHSSNAIPKPKLKLDQMTVDKSEEDLIMSELMRDDFPDDPSLQPDSSNSPLELPMIKSEIKSEPVKKEIIDNDMPESSQLHTMNGIKIKEDPDEKLGLGENFKELEPVNIQSFRVPTAEEIVNQHKENNFIFFQIAEIPRRKVSESAQPSKSAQKDAEKTEDEEKCTLKSLPSGKIGTLQILKSGRARLLMGDIQFDVDQGNHLSFKQELVSVDLNKENNTGNMMFLGIVQNTLLLKPIVRE